MTVRFMARLTLTFALTLGSTARAADDHSHHGQASDGPAVARLELDNGKKWPIDEALKVAMTVIRDDFNAAIKPIHAGTYSAKQYAALAAGIEKQIGQIVANCRLPPAADAQLHLVIADLAAGATAMKSPDKPMSGAVKIVRALGAYPKFFAHEGWKPLDH